MLAVSSENTNCSNGISMCRSTCSNQCLAGARRALKTLGLGTARRLEGLQRLLDQRMRCRAGRQAPRRPPGSRGYRGRPRNARCRRRGRARQFAGIPASAADGDEWLPRAVLRATHAVERVRKILAAERSTASADALSRPFARMTFAGASSTTVEPPSVAAARRTCIGAAGRGAEAVAQGVTLGLRTRKQETGLRRVSCRPERSPTSAPEARLVATIRSAALSLSGDRIRRGAPELAAGLRCDALKGIGQPRGADGAWASPPVLNRRSPVSISTRSKLATSLLARRAPRHWQV